MNVWTLRIAHRHGEDIELHDTYEGAWSALVEWAREYWDEDAAVNYGGEVVQPLPEDEQQIVDHYFDGNETEFYTIQELPVHQHPGPVEEDV